MRLTLYALILAFAQSYALSGYAQATKLNLKMENSSVREVLLEIENISEFRFLYNSKMVDVDRKVSVNFKEQTIDKALNKLFKNTGAAYRIIDRQVVLYAKSEPVLETAELQQQQRTVSGKVTDSSGQPLPGVTIVLKGTTQGTVTNTDGEYSFSSLPEDATLVFSFVGMLTQEVVVGSQTSINVRMEEDVIGIEEVVAVGYSTQTKLTVTGSISSVSSEELEFINTPTLGEGILGKVAGISMTQSSGTPGESDPSMFIRGLGTFNQTEPLFIIDGVPNDKRSFMQLNPASIRDISVLKDASATAVYGVRGANGVIIVTTRRGGVGKITVDATASYGIQTPTKLLEFADSYQYSLAYNQMLLSDEKTSGFISDEHIAHYKNNDKPLLFPSTNWVNEVINNSASQSRANLNVSGGTDRLQYFTSLSYLNQNGLLTQYGPAMANFGYDRINLQTNIDVNITESTRLSFTSNSRIGNRIEPLPAQTTNMGTLWSRLYSIPPMTSVGEVDGKFINPDMRYLPEPIAFIEESFPQYLYRGDYRNAEENRFDFNFDFLQELKGITTDRIKFQ